MNVFLGNHKGLQSLRLENMDITGSVPFTEVMDLLQASHHLLERFRFSQIAQGSRRLYLDTLGDLEEQSSPTQVFLLEDGEVADFFNDFVDVVGPFKYHGTAESWEGVRDKIGLLKDDVRISHKHYRPEYEGFGSYWWSR